MEVLKKNDAVWDLLKYARIPNPVPPTPKRWLKLGGAYMGSHHTILCMFEISKLESHFF